MLEIRKIQKVALLVESSRAFGQRLVRGIIKYSQIHGPWAFYREPGGLEETRPRLESWGPDGIIAHITDRKNAEKIIPAGVPAVVKGIHERIPGLANIIGDTTAVGKMAAEHLLGRAFTYFGYCGFDEILWCREFSASFSKRIAEAGFKTCFYEQPRSPARRSWGKEQTFMADWLKSLPKPVALMACNDDRGQHVIEACKIAGLRVPEEVAILGVDNDEWICDLTDPPLSSITLNTERAGYEAAALLDKLIAGEKMVNQTVIVRPLRTVVRQSTNILAVDDQDVAEAMRFIRQHSKEPIQVGDVAAAVGLSRSPLQKRFCKILRHSIYEEIRRVRVDQVAWMLLETNMSVSQIALALGYLSEKHIARPFRREKGVSPLAYRKQYGSK